MAPDYCIVVALIHGRLDVAVALANGKVLAHLLDGKVAETELKGADKLNSVKPLRSRWLLPAETHLLELSFSIMPVESGCCFF